jgi:hypothetical protein
MQWITHQPYVTHSFLWEIRAIYLAS